MLKTLDPNVMFQILLDMLMMKKKLLEKKKKRKKKQRKMIKRMIEMIDNANILNTLRNVIIS